MIYIYIYFNSIFFLFPYAARFQSVGSRPFKPLEEISKGQESRR